MTPEEHDNIRFKLNYLNKPENASKLLEEDLEWAIRMQEFYHQQGWLSPRQMGIVDSLWERAQ